MMMRQTIGQTWPRPHKGLVKEAMCMKLMPNNTILCVLVIGMFIECMCIILKADNW